jgi:hypothetical protein
MDNVLSQIVVGIVVGFILILAKPIVDKWLRKNKVV